MYLEIQDFIVYLNQNNSRKNLKEIVESYTNIFLTTYNISNKYCQIYLNFEENFQTM